MNFVLVVWLWNAARNSFKNILSCWVRRADLQHYFKADLFCLKLNALYNKFWVHGQYAENKNAESLRAWKSRRNVQKPNLTKRSPFGFRRFFLGVFSSA